MAFFTDDFTITKSQHKQKVADNFAEAGIESTDDFRVLDEKDLEELGEGVPKVVKIRLSEAIAKHLVSEEAAPPAAKPVPAKAAMPPMLAKAPTPFGQKPAAAPAKAAMPPMSTKAPTPFGQGAKPAAAPNAR